MNNVNTITVLLARTSPAGVKSPPVARTCHGDNKQPEHEDRQHYSGPHRERTSAVTAATNNTPLCVIRWEHYRSRCLFTLKKLFNPAYYAYNATNVYTILCVCDRACVYACVCVCARVCVRV